MVRNIIKLRNKKLWILLLAGLSTVLIILLSVVKWHSLGSPSEGNITQTGQTTSNETQSNPTTKTFNAKEFSLQYPSGYTLSIMKPDGNLIESVILQNKSISDQISIRLTREVIGDDAGVTYRRSLPSTYKESATNSGTSFEKTVGGYEKDVYVYHETLTLSLIAMSPSGNNLSSVTQAIINSLNWK